MNKAQLINQDSGDYEWYTPPEIVDAAREVMGWINLDPASSEKANKILMIDSYYDELDNGLIRDWIGNIWMNHPFSRVNNPLWINKLLKEYHKQNIEQACCITYAATSEQWFKPLLYYTQCFLSPRTNYYLPDGTKKKGVTKGSVVTYLGWNTKKFKDVFSEFGVVK